MAAPDEILPVAEEATKVLQENGLLWSRAFRTWRPSGGDQGSEASSTIESVVSSLKDTVKARVEFHKQNPKLFQAFGSLIEGLTKLEGLIDKGVALDVSGKAALPWAAIKLGLGVEFSQAHMRSTEAYPVSRC